MLIKINKSTCFVAYCIISVALVMAFLTNGKAISADFTVPESKLLDSEFVNTRWGGTVSRTDVPGGAVQFAFSGLSDSGTGLKDDYPVDTVYGQVLPSHGNGDFSNFSGYALRFENIDSESVSVNLFINTGFTGPSGIPPNDLRNDTFWQSPWTEIPAGQTKVIRLDFDSAIGWSIEDNPSPHTQGTNGVATSINDFDRKEVSAIGFEVAGPGGNSEATIRVSPVFCPLEMKGVSYTAWSPNALLTQESDQSLANAREIGCNWIAICVWWFQDNVNSSVIEPDYTRYSASPESVVHAIETCHNLGMKVMLKPMIDCRDGSWRGNINPSAAWFTEYHDFINFWADIAQNNNAELFCAGCEFVNTVSWTSSWRSVIQDLRTNHYSGPLTYAANHGNEENVYWWDELDFIGIDAYYSLTSNSNPTLAELKTAWNNRANLIESWRNSNWSNKDVIFVEVGYQSADGTNKTPWWTDPSGAIDLQEQADCYAALLSQCRGRNWWKGAFWWNWETDPNAGGPMDPYHPMQNKPAEQVLRDYYTVLIDINAPNDPGTGTADDPLRRIQDAINQASDGDVLLVAPGTYTGCGNVDLNFQGKNLYLQSENGPHDSVVDCSASESDPHRGFYFHSGENNNAILKGLSIINGWASDGGAVYCDVNSHPTLINCIIAGNSATNGGGIACHDSHPGIVNNTIVGNSASNFGGGIYCVSGCAKITNSIIWSCVPDQIHGSPQTTYTDVDGCQPGLGNIDSDPCFAFFVRGGEPKFWDLHLRSETGRWDVNSGSWVNDIATSQCVDAGHPAYRLGSESVSTSNQRINIGAYGGTIQASKTPVGWSLLADLTNDGKVDSKDFACQSKNWLKSDTYLAGDVTRDGHVNLEDLAVLREYWLKQTSWKDF